MSVNSREKARFWVGVLYVENMIEEWESDIGDIVQVPYSYCIHNMDTDSQSEHRTDHVHLILAFANTTTYKHALSVFDLLSAPGKKAINTCKKVINVRQMYEYLIHNTETCRKKCKYLYDVSCRVNGNNFDIGSYEQLDIALKNEMLRELCDLIIREGFYNFGDFYMHVISAYEDTNYFDVLKSHSNLLVNLTKSNFQRMTKNNL